MSSSTLSEWGPIHPATPVVQGLCDMELPEINKKLGTNFKVVTALKFREQTWTLLPVPAKNYKILAKAQDDYMVVVIDLRILKKPDLKEAEFLPTK
ncbi:hypothetical protein AAFF_G00202200 [Aldrovandia affinis]|uniref:Uncharacterized protein n=1 Tax=Aldrovandia affinis TaxID=143900 RepID=A0AAD7SWU2_9TELE|nr:hypothetical protein AAFF_G00202200 [Aldrovandia affinis]